MPPRVITLENRQQFKELLKRETDVIVKASAGWCGPCKMITPYFDEFANDFYTNKIVIVKLDVDVGRDLASYLKVQSIPQLFYYKNGEIKKTIVGSDMETLRKFLESIL